MYEMGLPVSTHKILQPGASYSFRSYFNLPNDTDEILAEFAYSFTQARLQLPGRAVPLSASKTCDSR